MRLAIAALAVALALPVAARAQETSLPANEVAEVAGAPILRDDFVHWMTIANTSATDDPRTPLPPLGSADFQRLTRQVIQLLVSFRWIDGEAGLRGISVTDAQVRHSFDEQKRQSFPKDGDYQKFLADSGQTEADILQRVRLDMLSNRIRDQVVKGEDKVSASEISAFYRRNKARFALPEMRDLELVLTKDRATAQKAYDALKGGASWKAVARKYSIDDSSKHRGGRLPRQAKGTLSKALDRAVFSAAVGALEGPIKTPYGYYVFTVTRVIPASQQTLAQARSSIKDTLAEQHEQKALDAFVKDFTARWKAKTVCGTQYKVNDCGSTLPIAGG